MAAEHNVSRNIERSQSSINQLIEQEQVDVDRKSRSYYILESELYKWFRQCKESGNMIGRKQFNDKGLQLMKKYDDAPKTFDAKLAWLLRCKKRFEKLEEKERGSDHVKSSDKQFPFQELTHRLEKEDIKRDNVYIMFKTVFMWNNLTPKDRKKIDIHKFQGSLSVIFCTNITDWYNNHFVTLVKKRQQKTNVSDKVLLIVNDCAMLREVYAKDITQNDNFEIQFITGHNSALVKNRICKIIRPKCKKVFQDFCTSCDINIFVTTIGKAWDNIRSETVKTFWKTLSDSCTKEITMVTSLVNQTPKLIINVTEKDTTLKEVSAQVEEPKNKSVGEYREEVTPPDDIIEYINSHKEDEEKEHQEQQDNDKYHEKIKDIFIKYYGTLKKSMEKNVNNWKAQNPQTTL